MKNRRKRLLIDRKVQGAILKRVFVYWLFCVLFIMTPILIVHALRHPELSFSRQLCDIGANYWMSLLLAVLLLPMALMDALRLSHGFIGPMIRLRRQVERLAAQPGIEFSGCRETDFWGQLAVDVGRAADDLEGEGEQADSELGERPVDLAV